MARSTSYRAKKRVEPDAEPQSFAAREQLGVREQIDLLHKVAPTIPKPASTARAFSLFSSLPEATIRRVAKSAIALALALALGWVPLQRLISTTSAEATVNARVITLRAPIEGRITDWRSNSGIGTPLNAGDSVLQIENVRADRSYLDELRRKVTALADQRAISTQRIARLEELRAEQIAQFQTFKSHRIAHIEARRRELVADKEAAAARLEASGATLKRSSALYDRGYQAQSAYEAAVREQKVAQANIVALDRRVEATDIELTAAREGTFVADGYNDVPRSAQRAAEIEQQIAEAKLSMIDDERKLAGLRAQLEEEAARYQTLSVASMTSPTEGRVWEILTSPGEDVHRGQELMRILDCRGAVVTAAVSEATYNKLRLSGAAAFRMRGDDAELPGRIVGLHGMASVPANLAIHQKMLAREPYHVTVEVPALARGDSCQVGRTGIVTFDTSTGL